MKRLGLVWFVRVAVAMLTPTSVATATPVTYNESVSGDLPASCPCGVFAFDVGINSVIGSTIFDSSPLELDFDNFAFSIPSGMQLTDVTYNFTVTLPGPSSADYFELESGNPGSPFTVVSNGSVYFPLATSPVDLFGAGLPLGSGTYTLDNYAATGNWAASYRWDFTVAKVDAIPEPGSLTLLGLGLLGLARWPLRTRSRR